VGGKASGAPKEVRLLPHLSRGLRATRDWTTPPCHTATFCPATHLPCEHSLTAYTTHYSVPKNVGTYLPPKVSASHHTGLQPFYNPLISGTLQIQICVSCTVFFTVIAVEFGYNVMKRVNVLRRYKQLLLLPRSVMLCFTVRNSAVIQNIRSYRRGAAKTVVVLTGFDSMYT
jgi:hypothetical protein